MPGLISALCLLCAEATQRAENLCLDCEERLPWMAPGCACCALPRPEIGPGQPLCSECLREPPAFDRCLTLFDYQPPVDRLISRFKYQADFSAGRCLQELLTGQLQRHYEAAGERLPQRVIPVPLHRSRLRHRGFNQSMELARPLARRLGVKLDHRSCKRSAATAAQQRLDRAQRQKNMNRAFCISRPALLESIEHVALIDDVVTTGATTGALSRLLREHGLRRIDVWCLARVNPQE